MNNITFIDIESVPETAIPDQDSFKFSLFKKLYISKLSPANYLVAEKITAYDEWVRIWKENAALSAQFGKIVAVSIGKMHGTKFHVKSIVSRFENKLLEQLTLDLVKSNGKTLCGHNSMEFDFPFLNRRYIINQLPLPEWLDFYGKKTWEIPCEDTMKMWSGTQWNYRVSLQLLSNVLGLPDPKATMSGDQVAGIFYGALDVPGGELPFDKEEAALRKIGEYCSNDVVTTAKIYCRLRGIPLFEDDQIAPQIMVI